MINNLYFRYVAVIVLMSAVEVSNAGAPSWLKDLFNYIDNNLDTHRQVMIITTENSNRKIENYWTERILIEAMSNYPTYCINEDSMMGEEKWFENNTDATGTLFIFISDALTPRLNSPQEIMDIMKKLSLNKNYISYLMIMLSVEAADDFDELLEYSWRIKMGSLAILELLHCRRTSGIMLKICEDYYTPTIYNYNPFLDLKIKRNHERGIDWFPNFMNNLYGYPLNVAVVNKPPFSLVTWDENLRCKDMRGLDISIMQAIAEQMNFTPVILPSLTKYYKAVLDSSEYGLLKVMSTGTVDVLASLNPHYTEEMTENWYRTGMIIIDEFCSLVPVMESLRIPFSFEVIEAMILTIGIVLIFFAATNSFRFGTTWNIFLTMRVLFGIPVRQIYRKFTLSQRSVVQTLILISLFYSANIYGALTKISIEIDEESGVRTFEDLDNSGLIPMIPKYLYNKTFGRIDDHEGALLSLKKKTVSDSLSLKCLHYAEKYRNVTCLIQKLAGEVFVNLRYRNGKPTMKLVRQCFWSDSFTFLVQPGSPYRKRINELFIIFSEVGLKIKWYRDTKIFMNVNNDDNRKEDLLDELTVPKGVLQEQLMAVLLFGITIATIVFIGEIFWYYVKKRRRNNEID